MTMTTTMMTMMIAIIYNPSPVGYIVVHLVVPYEVCTELSHEGVPVDGEQPCDPGLAGDDDLCHQQAVEVVMSICPVGHLCCAAVEVLLVDT